MPRRIQHSTVVCGLWSVDSPQWVIPLLVALMMLMTWGAGEQLSRGIPDPWPSDYHYLTSLQRPDGSICMTPQQERTVPYFSNLAAMVMLEYPQEIPRVKSYLQWYLSHLNRPDHFGLHGTIYDYVYTDDREISTRDYDSADSYAATFLSLAYRYLLVTGDRQFVTDHLSDLERVAGVLLQLQDLDGLIWAKPDYPLKYLMDNAENYRGIADFAALLATTGLHDASLIYAQRAQQLRRGIETRLWDPTTGRYHWAIDSQGRPQALRSDRWYPDGVAQLYPILHGLDEPYSARAIALYAAFNQQFPRWPELDKGDPYPWAVVAYVAAQMNDIERATRAVQTMTAKHLRATGQPYWYSLEHAFYLRTVERLRRGISHQPLVIR